MCNGLAINLISTIDIYDKLVIAWEKIKNKSISNGTSCCCKRKKLIIKKKRFNITLVTRNPKEISH
jgi:hypothetical protein